MIINVYNIPILDSRLIKRVDTIMVLVVRYWRSDILWFEDQSALRYVVFMWADPGSTATPGQPAVEQEQASNLHQFSKISLTFESLYKWFIRC